MTQPESKLSRKIMDQIRFAGYFCYKVHGNEYTMSGLPDIIVCAQGLFIGLETKMPDKRNNVSARQKFVHDEIGEAGGSVSVVCSPGEALAFIKYVIADHHKLTVPKMTSVSRKPRSTQEQRDRDARRSPARGDRGPYRPTKSKM